MYYKVNVITNRLPTSEPKRTSYSWTTTLYSTRSRSATTTSQPKLSTITMYHIRFTYL